MAIARKCDRCGKLYEYYPICSRNLRLCNKIQYNGVQRIYNHINGGYDSDSPLDFCPECMSAFDEFMIRGKSMDVKKEV